jgi:hypothetical protein
VHDDVRDRLDIAFDDGGSQTLQNIARPVQILHLATGVAALYTPRLSIRTVSIATRQPN